MITLAGGLLGLAAAPLVAQALLVFVSRDGNLAYQLDTRVLLFTLLASVLTGAICGVAPALQTGRVPLIAALTDRSRLTSARGVRLRKTLIVAQLALTLLLLMAAVLFVQTLTHLRERVGFASNQLLMFGVDPMAVGIRRAAGGAGDAGSVSAAPAGARRRAGRDRERRAARRRHWRAAA